ncbi:hypothetical protein HanPSC8_Chr13g0588851 [Helianthus annuus]|nr:hypothetical protein HanPSC8_Chr13g0588851 [Helianthus annuus]
MEILVCQPTETNNHTPPRNTGLRSLALVGRSLLPTISRSSLPRILRFDAVTPPGLASASTLEEAAVTNDQVAASNDGSGYVDPALPDLMDSVDLYNQRLRAITPPGLASATTLEEAAVTNDHAAASNDVFRSAVRALRGFYDSVRRWAPRSYLGRLFGEDPDVGQPAETNNQGSFFSNVNLLLAPVTKPGFAFELIIFGLFCFAEIKSQGEADFPFKTHPQITTVGISSVPVYALCSFAQHAISVVGPGRDSTYAFIARLGRSLCLCTLFGSLVCMFFL